MKLVGRLEIKSYEKIKEFLSQEHVGRIASIDGDGYPQIIPMNFVFANDAIYMHSYTRGEKLDNISRNDKVGFEVDRELEFLPSYFSHPTDASQADTLYISVVLKGKAVFVEDDDEKAFGLNELMKKYQPEGNYIPIQNNDLVLDEVAVIKIIPESLKGKYKIGQQLNPE
ncbi:MAG: pyridoxamine 5'-phosphate oxidase family protein, partial [Nitrosopumilus sp.]